MSGSTSSATSSQSPLICIPQKTTTEVDLATPVRSLISASYGEDPKKWMDQTNGLNRARQDAVRGAGTGDGKGKGDAVGEYQGGQDRECAGWKVGCEEVTLARIDQARL